MPSISNMREVLMRLVKKTKEGRIRWDLDPDWNTARPRVLPERQGTSVFVSSFIARFPYSVIRVQFVETDSGLNYAEFVVEEVEGGLLGEWWIFHDDSNSDWASAHELFQLLTEQYATGAIARLVEQIKQSEQAPENVAPLDDLATQFFKRIAGHWHLTYYRGNKGFPEECRIDEKGQYFTAKRGGEPYFYLRDVFYDPDGNNVSFTKVEAAGPKKGQARQVELLQIDPNGRWMKGYAQHDRHRLEYVRKTGPGGPR